MSSLKINKYKIALFIPGLGQDGSFFNDCIYKMTQLYNNVILYNNILNLNNFNIKDNKFYGTTNNSLFPSNDILKSYSLEISNIISLCINNPNKTILIRVTINNEIYSLNKDGSITYNPFDSIDNQVIKLNKIIGDILLLENKIKITLIGHSQGGLVNLKYATLYPNKISNLISISTPYTQVTVANYLKDIDYIFHLFNNCVNKNIGGISQYYKSYDERVNTLSDLTFYENLKNDWNKLPNRPKLTVIAGISAHLMTSKYFYFIVPFEINYRYPFDGLVLGREQIAIENATIYVLHDEGIECYENSNNFAGSCCTEFNILNHHECNHLLPYFDISDAIISSTLELIKKSINSDEIKFNEFPIVQAINEARENKECSNKDYIQYYNILANKYSHLNICKQNKTISIILGVLESA